MKTIRKYHRKGMAQRYANKLKVLWPNSEFHVIQHPYDFGWAIGRWNADRTHIAYVC
jgi:hypothetical protein